MDVTCPPSLRLAVCGLTGSSERNLAALAGVTLAIALVALANVSFDSASQQTLKMALNESPIDLIL